MPNHTIRLRGGWRGYEATGAALAGTAAWVALPIVWPAGLSGPLRLERRFQAPPAVAGSEALAIVCEDVPGLVSIALNGRTLATAPFSSTAIRVGLARRDIQPRGNLLALEVLPGPPDPGRPWGRIALEVVEAERGRESR